MYGLHRIPQVQRCHASGKIVIFSGRAKNSNSWQVRQHRRATQRDHTKQQIAETKAQTAARLKDLSEVARRKREAAAQRRRNDQQQLAANGPQARTTMCRRSISNEYGQRRRESSAEGGDLSKHRAKGVQAPRPSRQHRQKKSGIVEKVHQEQQVPQSNSIPDADPEIDEAARIEAARRLAAQRARQVRNTRVKEEETEAEEAQRKRFHKRDERLKRFRRKAALRKANERLLAQAGKIPQVTKARQERDQDHAVARVPAQNEQTTRSKQTGSPAAPIYAWQHDPKLRGDGDYVSHERNGLREALSEATAHRNETSDECLPHDSKERKTSTEIRGERIEPTTPKARPLPNLTPYGLSTRDDVQVPHVPQVPNTIIPNVGECPDYARFEGDSSAERNTNDRPSDQNAPTNHALVGDGETNGPSLAINEDDSLSDFDEFAAEFAAQAAEPTPWESGFITGSVDVDDIMQYTPESTLAESEVVERSALSTPTRNAPVHNQPEQMKSPSFPASPRLIFSDGRWCVYPCNLTAKDAQLSRFISLLLMV